MLLIKKRSSKGRFFYRQFYSWSHSEPVLSRGRTLLLTNTFSENSHLKVEVNDIV